MDIVHCFKPAEHLDQAIYRDPETGVYIGATEMRKDGQALGY